MAISIARKSFSFFIERIFETSLPGFFPHSIRTMMSNILTMTKAFSTTDKFVRQSVKTPHYFLKFNIHFHGQFIFFLSIREREREREMVKGIFVCTGESRTH